MGESNKDLIYSIAVLYALVIQGAVCTIRTGNPLYFIPLIAYILVGYFFTDE